LNFSADFDSHSKVHSFSRDIPITGIELANFYTLELEYIDRSHFLMTMKYPKAGVEYWVLLLLAVDFEGKLSLFQFSFISVVYLVRTSKCLDSKILSHGNFELTLEEKKRQTFMIHQAYYNTER
jgi:hypothetical protein